MAATIPTYCGFCGIEYETTMTDKSGCPVCADKRAEKKTKGYIVAGSMIASLVAMLGTSGGITTVNGKLGDHRKVSSRVACVVDFFGPTDLFDFYKSSSTKYDR